MDIQQSIDPVGVDDLARQIGYLAEFEEISAKYWKAAMRQVVTAAQRRARADAPVATGATRRGIRSSVRAQGTSVTGRVAGSQIRNVIIPGRSAGSKQPRVERLRQYLSSKGVPDGDLDQVTYLVARKIARDGIPPRPFMDNANAQAEQQVGPAFAEANRKIVDELAVNA